MSDDFHLDVATGEKIIPSEILWKYTPILGEAQFDIFIYRPERILAEKLQTALDRGVLNTRMKDFYDIYTIPKFSNINMETLSLSFKVVMTERNTLNQWSRRNTIIMMIKEDEDMNKNWLNYKKSHDFVGELNFIDVVQATQLLLNKITDPNKNDTVN